MENEVKPGLFSRIKSFTIQSKRVWHVLRKPTGDEFKGVAKISALGLLVVGAVGFVISDVIKIVGRMF